MIYENRNSVDELNFELEDVDHVRENSDIASASTYASLSAVDAQNRTASTWEIFVR